MKIRILFYSIGIFVLTSCKSSQQTNSGKVAQIDPKEANIQVEVVEDQSEKPFIINKRGDKIELISKSDEEWKKQLTKEEYYVLREKGTERAFSGDLWENKKGGLYTCAGCEVVLFTSSAKFDSGTGWPSFFRTDDDTMIKKESDTKIGYPRTEVMCARCGGHLGHVFDDGPPPTGMRYCINSVSLNFIESKD